MSVPEVRITTTTRRRPSGCCVGLIVLLVVVIVAISVVGALLPFLAPRLIESALGPNAGARLAPLLNLPGEATLRDQLGMETKEIDGVEPNRFEPFDAVGQVQAFAGQDAELVKITVFGVRRDGTLDLTATYTPAPDATYEFRRRLAAPPPNAPPVGAGGTGKGDWVEPIKVRAYQPGAMRTVTQTGGGSSIRVQFVNRGLTRERGQAVTETFSPLPPPTCSLAALWQVALIRGAPPDAIATVEYARDGYQFSIRGTQVNLAFGPDCQVRR